MPSPLVSLISLSGIWFVSLISPFLSPPGFLFCKLTHSIFLGEHCGGNAMVSFLLFCFSDVFVSLPDFLLIWGGVPSSSWSQPLQNSQRDTYDKWMYIQQGWVQQTSSHVSHGKSLKSHIPIIINYHRQQKLERPVEGLQLNSNSSEHEQVCLYRKKQCQIKTTRRMKPAGPERSQIFDITWRGKLIFVIQFYQPKSTKCSLTTQESTYWSSPTTERKTKERKLSEIVHVHSKRKTISEVSAIDRSILWSAWL